MATATRPRKTARKKLSPAQVEKRAAERKAKADALHATLETQVDALASSEQWASYLAFAQSFHRYSFTNMMLIFAQRPTATQVAGYAQWQERGRQVISKAEGAQSIGIYGYATKRIVEEDEATGEKSERRIAYYPIRYVYDIADTVPITEEMLVKIKSGPRGNPRAKVWTGDHNPVRLLEGEDEADITRHVVEFLDREGWTFELETIRDGSNGYTELGGTKKVAVRNDLSPAATAKTALHELGHVLLHGVLETGQRHPDAPEERSVRELEAEAVAYVVAGALGLDTSDYSIGYLAGWSGGDGKAVAATAERVLKAAQHILDGAFPLQGDDDTEEE